MNRQHEIHALSVPAPAAIGFGRSAALACCVVGAGFVLALALQGVHGQVGSPPKEHVFSAAATDVELATLGLALFVGLCLVAVARLWRDEALGERRGRARWWERLLIALVYAAIAIAAAAALASVYGAAHKQLGSPGRAGSRAVGPGRQTGPTASGHVHWSSFAAIAAGALLGVCLLAFLYRSESVRRSRRPSARDALARAAAVGIGELEAEPDPRRAVIRCYAAMEGSLGELGLPRHRAETPFEYFGRLLGRLEAGAQAAARLTPLFERAKFSRHEIDQAMRDEALDAVRGLRREVSR